MEDSELLGRLGQIADGISNLTKHVDLIGNKVSDILIWRAAIDVEILNRKKFEDQLQPRLAQIHDELKVISSLASFRSDVTKDLDELREKVEQHQSFFDRSEVNSLRLNKVESDVVGLRTTVDGIETKMSENTGSKRGLHTAITLVAVALAAFASLVQVASAFHWAGMGGK